MEVAPGALLGPWLRVSGCPSLCPHPTATWGSATCPQLSWVPPPLPGAPSVAPGGVGTRRDATTPQSHRATMSPCPCVAVPWYRSATVPCQSDTVPRQVPCHRATVFLCHSATVPPCHGATIPLGHRAMMPPSCDATVPWCHDPMVPPYHWAVMPPCRCAMVPW